MKDQSILTDHSQPSRQKPSPGPSSHLHRRVPERGSQFSPNQLPSHLSTPSSLSERKQIKPIGGGNPKFRQAEQFKPMIDEVSELLETKVFSESLIHQIVQQQKVRQNSRQGGSQSKRHSTTFSQDDFLDVQRRHQK